MNTLRVEVLRSMLAVNGLRRRMDELNLAARRPCPFSTYEYLETFLDHDEYGTRGPLACPDLASAPEAFIEWLLTLGKRFQSPILRPDGRRRGGGGG